MRENGVFTQSGPKADIISKVGYKCFCRPAIGYDYIEYKRN